MCWTARSVCLTITGARTSIDCTLGPSDAASRPALTPVVFCAFDLLVHQGLDVRALPLKTRKRRLAQLLRRQRPSVLLVDGIAERGTWLFIQALELKLEGIVSKRLIQVRVGGAEPCMGEGQAARRRPRRAISTRGGIESVITGAGRWLNRVIQRPVASSAARYCAQPLAGQSERLQTCAGLARRTSSRPS